MNIIKRIFGIKSQVSKKHFGKVELSEGRVTYYHPSDDPQSIKWNDLIEVGIVTTDEGPYNEDVYFMLLGVTQKDGCAIPQGADGVDILLEHLQKLEGFNNEELIKAMGSTSNNRFVLWKNSNLAQPGA